MTMRASEQTLLSLSCFDFSIFSLETGRLPKLKCLQGYHWPARGQHPLLSSTPKLCLYAVRWLEETWKRWKKRKSTNM